MRWTHLILKSGLPQTVMSRMGIVNSFPLSAPTSALPYGSVVFHAALKELNCTLVQPFLLASKATPAVHSSTVLVQIPPAIAWAFLIS